MKGIENEWGICPDGKPRGSGSVPRYLRWDKIYQAEIEICMYTFHEVGYQQLYPLWNQKVTCWSC